LDLDQATKLLEDHDINEVLNKLPDEAFDIFTGEKIYYSGRMQFTPNVT
jgi:hypothetical protein